MNTLWKATQQYCESLSSEPDALLQALQRETHLKTLAPQMSTGPLQGAFLRLLSKLQQPHYVLEIGTFTGYGSLCLAAGLRPGGELHTIEANRELAHISKKYIALAGLQDCIIQHTGDALEILPALPHPFDLVYLDGNKLQYPQYYDLVIDQMPDGGLLLADNVLWSGKVVQGVMDSDTRALNSFNQKVYEDPRVSQVLLPLRDGLLLVRKESNSAL
jgi:caffeoyl-CoA O-methyltransferase